MYWNWLKHAYSFINPEEIQYRNQVNPKFVEILQSKFSCLLIY